MTYAIIILSVICSGLIVYLLFRDNSNSRRVQDDKDIVDKLKGRITESENINRQVNAGTVELESNNRESTKLAKDIADSNERAIKGINEALSILDGATERDID